MNPRIDKNLLERYFQKKCTVEEAGKVIDWLNDPENQNAIEVLLSERWSKAAGEFGVKGALDKVHKRVKEKIAGPLQKERKPAGSIFYWVTAAAIALIVASTVFFVNTKPDSSPKTYTISSVDGRRTIKTLPDGSVAYLNGAASITLTERFNSTDRHIKLTGEAYFEVASNLSLPFIVEAGPVLTEAIGTAFNVNARPESGKIRVSLVEGKVRVTTLENAGEEARMLAPGEEIAYSVQGEYLGEGKLNRKDIAWKDGILVLDEVDVDELERKLEQWYGVEVVFENRPQKNWRFTSEYDNESLKNVLEGLKFSKNLHYAIKNDSVVVTFFH